MIKRNFVTLVAHEFRTPLGVIMSAAEILEHYFERLGADRRREHLQDIQLATRQLSELTEQVLSVGPSAPSKAGMGRRKKSSRAAPNSSRKPKKMG